MRIFYSAMALTLVAVPLASAAAAEMDVGTFLTKADALRAKGAMALFSSDIGVLKREVNSAAMSLRVERLAQAKAGQKSAYCPPAKGSMDSDELIAAMRAVPAAERSRTEVRTVLRTIMVRKYPCPA